jgi:hypothetical protein
MAEGWDHDPGGVFSGLGCGKQPKYKAGHSTSYFILLNSYFLDGLIQTADQARGKIGLIPTS